MQAKNPIRVNSRWVATQQIFVADVGTMTETYTLEFTSRKQCTYTSVWELPAHPATYVNADGTVDLIPGSSSRSVSVAAWKFRRGTLTLTFEDGSSKEFSYAGGALRAPSGIPGEDLVFTQEWD